MFEVSSSLNCPLPSAATEQMFRTVIAIGCHGRSLQQIFVLCFKTSDNTMLPLHFGVPVIIICMI